MKQVHSPYAFPPAQCSRLVQSRSLVHSYDYLPGFPFTSPCSLTSLQNVTKMLFSLLIFASACRGVLTQDVPVPIQVSASNSSYGPDGPWQAVTIELGTPPQKLDLYAGSTFETIILEDSVCDKQPLPCGAGGLYKVSASSTVDDTSIAFSGHSYGDLVDWTFGAMHNTGTAIYIMDNLTIGSLPHGFSVPDLSIRMMRNVSTTFPNGSKFPLQVGQLALGASTANQTFTEPGGPSINASLAPNYLQHNGKIASASYGLHIGSAALKLPLSLWLGGYDMSRVIGPVSAQPYSADVTNNNFIIDLLDIGVGVDHGGSPFSYSSRGGILAEGNDSISTVPVIVNPTAPYLYLPRSTCAALAKDLPLTYIQSYGLYFWNASDPQYGKIITSPTYLGFTFRGSAQNLTIKVPLNLLNLTLDRPLIDKPTPYFPCTTPQDSSSYSLGRAFLQAAFIGVDWDQGLGQWFLAQAPGPSTASNPSQMAITDLNLRSSESNWADTWRPVWTPLPESTTNSTTTSSSTSQSFQSPAAAGPPAANTPPSSTKLSPGSSAGIGISVVLIVLGATLAGLFLWRRRRRQRRSDNPPTNYLTSSSEGTKPPSKHHHPPPVYEAQSRQCIYEAPAMNSPAEVPAAATSMSHELPSGEEDHHRPP